MKLPFLLHVAPVRLKHVGGRFHTAVTPVDFHLWQNVSKVSIVVNLWWRAEKKAYHPAAMIEPYTPTPACPRMPLLRSKWQPKRSLVAMNSLQGFSILESAC